MAQGSDALKAVDKGKGKGKAVDNSKDEKPVLNGKKDDEKKKSEYGICQNGALYDMNAKTVCV